MFFCNYNESRPFIVNKRNPLSGKIVECRKYIQNLRCRINILLYHRMNNNIFIDAFAICEILWDKFEGKENVLIIGDHSGIVSKTLNEKLGKEQVVTLEGDKLMIELGEMNVDSYNIENKEFMYERDIKLRLDTRGEIMYHYTEFIGKQITDDSLQECDKTTVEEISSKYQISFDTLIVDAMEYESIKLINMDNINKLIIFKGRNMFMHSQDIEMYMKEKKFKMTEKLFMPVAYMSEVSMWEKL